MIRDHRQFTANLSPRPEQSPNTECEHNAYCHFRRIYKTLRVTTATNRPRMGDRGSVGVECGNARYSH
jgi:hypothetical protein